MVMPTQHTTITMNNPSIIRLMTLLSPVFPIGGFAYSAGLETASQAGNVSCSDGLRQWIETALLHGALRNDAILLAAAHRQDRDLVEINDLALALAGSAERYHESINLGAAFAKAASPWIDLSRTRLPDPVAYCVAVGEVSSGAGLELRDVLQAYLQAAVSNQLQAALRLVSMGQQEAVRLQHDFEQLIEHCATETLERSLDDLGSSAIAMEIACMQHETLSSRIFRS